METLLSAVDLLANPMAILAMFTGTLIGIIVGALPGLGSVVALTICLPFTFSMGQIPAITLLLGVYCGSVYGGSVSAILINTPGTPQSAATCLDGYPMAQRGEAGLALGWATMASVFGGIFSCFVLILAAPQLAAIALKFGPIETFALITLAMTCIAAISVGSMVKGLFAGVLGLACATMGSDPMTGDLRFTFGFFTLTAGFNLIAVVVGMFALSEVFVRIAAGMQGQVNLRDNPGIKLPKWPEWKPRMGTLLRSSAIGSFVGVLPGTGAATAAFMSYASAKQSSPFKDKLGTGEPDGIVASESANNAVTGGALVPTLALGIPGDAITAVMMTTMIIHGITPGVRLMTDSADVVFACFMALIVINIFVLGQAILLAKGFTRILRTPEPLMLTMIVILSLLGSYGVRGNGFDLLVTVGFGVFGFLLRANGFPIAPVVIGLVLGPQFEESLRQGLILTDNSFAKFFTGHPIALGLFLTTAAVICLPIWRALRSQKTP